MTIAQVIIGFQLGSAAFAVPAAILWLKSAKVDTPDSFPISVVRPDGFGRPFGEPLGATYVGHGHSPALNELGAALRLQSKWSAWAARLAAAAAFCQALASLLDVMK